MNSESVDPGIVERFLSILENVEEYALAGSDQRVCFLCPTPNYAWTGYSELKKRLKVRRCNEITMWLELDNGSFITCHAQTDEQSIERIKKQHFHEMIVACPGDENENNINPLTFWFLAVVDHIKVIH